MAWALSQQDVTDAVARHVLLCLANYADAEGCGAFPSVARLCSDTGLSERSVRNKLGLLVELGVLVEGNGRIAAAYIDRGDRRPVVYDIPAVRGAPAAPREANGVQEIPNGVHVVPSRGARPAPNTSLNHQDPPTAQASPSRFEDWWTAYPKKVGKKPAKAKWRTRGLDRIADTLIEDVRKRAAEDDGWKRGYIPDPLTYLNQDRWEDELRKPPQQRGADGRAEISPPRQPDASAVLAQSRATRPAAASTARAALAEAGSLLGRRTGATP